ncbi:MAG: ABC transporter ATP-binding protein, partial [Caldilineaceae bacterium]|nr:ABC transporter ATP-binding protein [Caldilineaceae bacterium]
MGFIMDGIGAEAYDRTYSDKELLHRVLSYFRPHFWSMIFVATMILLTAIMDAALPVLLAQGIGWLTEPVEG